MSLFSQPAFDALVLSHPGVSLVDQWDSRVAKVGGKVFALLGLDHGNGARIVFKCGEDSFEILTSLGGVGQAPYFAKRQWVCVEKDSELLENELAAYIARSHGIIAKGLTKKLRAELGID